MFRERKNPRFTNSKYGDLSARVKKDNDGSDYILYRFSDISEDGIQLWIDPDRLVLSIGDSVAGVIVDRTGEPLTSFAGQVVWVDQSNLGIRYYQEITIPNQIIAMEIADLG
jgi:hypothetical protein